MYRRCALSLSLCVDVSYRLTMNLVQSPAHVLKGLRKLHAVFGLAKHDCLLFEVLEGHLAHIGLRFLLIFAEHRGSKKDNPGMVFFCGDRFWDNPQHQEEQSPGSVLSIKSQSQHQENWGSVFTNPQNLYHYHYSTTTTTTATTTTTSPTTEGIIKNKALSRWRAVDVVPIHISTQALAEKAASGPEELWCSDFLQH